ncbi:MAG: replication initiation protein [Pseudomonadota bacterium]
MEKALKHVIKRPNETIGIVPNGKQRITHLVRRLYSVILLFSQQQGEKEEYAAVLSEMLDAASSSGSNRTQVKEILRDIRAIGVDWNVRDGEREIWKNVGLIEEPGLIDGKGTPTIVTWKLPKIIQTRLLDPRGFFTKISLEMMTRLRSGASIALYEICCQYVSNDHGKGEGGLTNRGTIAEWMPRLTGSRKANYEYKFLKRDVVMTAIEEINEITDLRVELIEHKVGRKVGELQFRVFRKHVVDSMQGTPILKIVSTLPDPAAGNDDGPVQRIMAIGAPLKTAERIHRKYAQDLSYLVRHLAYVEARVRNTTSPPLVNKVAFLQKALDHGYADVTTPLFQVAASNPLPAVPAESPAAEHSAESIMAQQQILARRAGVWARFQALDNDSEKSVMVKEFLEQTGTTLKTFYKKNGVNNMIVKASLTDWLIAEKNF